MRIHILICVLACGFNAAPVSAQSSEKDVFNLTCQGIISHSSYDSDLKVVDDVEADKISRDFTVTGDSIFQNAGDGTSIEFFLDQSMAKRNAFYRTYSLTPTFVKLETGFISNIKSGNNEPIKRTETTVLEIDRLRKTYTLTGTLLTPKPIFGVFENREAGMCVPRQSLVSSAEAMTEVKGKPSKQFLTDVAEKELTTFACKNDLALMVCAGFDPIGKNDECVTAIRKESAACMVTLDGLLPAYPSRETFRAYNAKYTECVMTRVVSLKGRLFADVDTCIDKVNISP